MIQKTPDGPSDAGYHFIQLYRNCKRKWYYKYVHRLEEIAPTSPALIFGKSMHSAMEGYYTTLRDVGHVGEAVTKAKEMFTEAIADYEDDFILATSYSDEIRRGIKLIEDYALHYYTEGFKVLAVEETLSLPITDNTVFTGRIDLVVQTKEARNYIVDHKFTGWSMFNFSRSIKISDQATGYIMLWRGVKDIPISGCIFNIVRNYKGSSEFQRNILYKTEEDVAEFQKDLVADVTDLYSRLLTPDARWPKNTDRCFDYNRACEFYDLCQGSNFSALLGVKYRQRTSQDEEDAE